MTRSNAKSMHEAFLNPFLNASPCDASSFDVGKVNKRVLKIKQVFEGHFLSFIFKMNIKKEKSYI